MLRRAYERTLELSRHPAAIPFLALVAFLESSVFPIPPDVMLIPMVLAARRRAWHLAAICTVASVLGGLAGYAIGAGLYQSVGRFLLELYGYGDVFSEFVDRYNRNGAWIVLIAGLTPFPYKVITIASGVTQLDLGIFLAASAAARGLRFFLVAGLLYYIGPPIRAFVEKRLGLVFALFFIILIGGFAFAGLLT